MVGSLGAFLGKYNIYIFGYFAYIYPIILIILIYFSFKNIKNFTARLVELISGLSLLFFTILIAQATIFSTNKGLIGQAIVISLKDMIGSAGMWVFIVMMFVLSLVLIFEEKITTIIKKSFITPKKHLEIMINTKKDNDETLNHISNLKENEILEKDNQEINLTLEKEDSKIVWALAIIGAIAAVAGIAFAVYKYLTPDYMDDFDEDFDDDFDDDFFDEEDDTDVKEEDIEEVE